MGFPIVLQQDERDCGAACLAMISKYMGLSMPISRFRELTKTDRTGTTLFGLIDGGHQIGLASEALSGDFSELMQGIENEEICFPFIAHTVSENKMLHFIVIYGHKNGRFLVADPGKGRCSIDDSAFSNCWTGYIATFMPTSDFSKGNRNKDEFLKFFGYLKGQYPKLGGIMLLSLLMALIGISGAFVFEAVIDGFLTDVHYYEETESLHDHENHEHEENEELESDNPIDSLFERLDNATSIFKTTSFNLVFILLISLYFFSSFIEFVRGYLISSLSRKIDIRLTLTYFNHLMDLPVQKINVLNTGEYLTRFSDTSIIRNAISGAVVTMIMDSLMVFVGGVILFNKNKTLFFVALITTLLYALLVCVYRKPLDRSNREVMGYNANLESFLKEAIDGIETIKAANAIDQIKQSSATIFDKFINSVFKNSLLSFSQDALADAVELISTAIILWIGFTMVMNNTQTVGGLITFYALLGYFTEPIKNLIQLQPTIQSAYVAADRLNDILEQHVELNKEDKFTIQSVNEWRMDKVNFRYGNHELALKDVSLYVRKGEKIALVGESGCGKTTIARLLMRFYTQESGHIILDNHSIHSVNLESLRKKISYVSQDTFLFADTIRNNLLLGNQGINEDEIVKICKEVQIHNFIANLPLGYDTPLEENGANLSGGQRQRLGIARALLKKPQLLILDEATSHLDASTEAHMKNGILLQASDMSIVIIAHRLSTVKDCDRIYVMKEGCIVETGTHDQLMSQKGYYTKLWKSQFDTLF